MGLFDRFSKKEEPACLLENELEYKEYDFYDMNSRFAGQTMATQVNQRSLVEEFPHWEINVGTGKVIFGEKPYQAQYIGKLVPKGHRGRFFPQWIWAWDDPMDFPETSLVLAQEMKAFGEQHNIMELKQSRLNVSTIYNQQTNTTVPCALYSKQVSYIPYEENGEKLYVAVEGLDPKIFEPVGLEDAIFVVQTVLENFLVNHRLFLESFFQWNKTPYDLDIENCRIIAHFEVDLVFHMVKKGKRLFVENISFDNSENVIDLGIIE